MENNIGSNLKKLRELGNYSRKKIADMLGVNEMSIGAYERNEKNPTIDKLIKIADFFGVDLDTLIRGDVGELDKENAARQALYRAALTRPLEDVNRFYQILDYASEVNKKLLETGKPATLKIILNPPSADDSTDNTKGD